MFFLFSVSLFAADSLMGKELSFYGRSSLDEVARGELSRSVRRGDRSQGFYAYKVGMVSPLVNSNKQEDSDSFTDQIQSNKYGKIRFSKIEVTKFQFLSNEDQTHLLKFYTWEKLKEKNWVVTVLKFEFLGEKTL